MTKLSFEKALERLETLVQEMESGELSLENALKKFEEGVKLSQLCTQKLNETEKKIALLMEQGDGSLTETPFGDTDQDDLDA
ncbi:exodeoxyribonuclease VII small subunit [Desulfatitalea tepidiphila]|uniref:exodeoxyribonuclease VII small subunit n=1 Tax=Desulfatitalea tepidiphila TaxID=1185843 RepID=UPI0006B6462C|nr:exodeoxyribonuclease VII small subunit [Desulfatitalea tepidiphila]